MTTRIRPETPDDHDDVRRVVTAAFGDETVAVLVDRLRVSSAWRDLSLVAVDGVDLVGHVMATRGWLDAPERLVEVLVLSPLSVDPARQRQGVGGALVRHLLDACAGRPEPAVLLEGSPRYYPRFGFRPAVEDGIRKPSLRIPDAACQVHWLVDDHAGLTGTLVYPDAFWELDAVGLR